MSANQQQLPPVQLPRVALVGGTQFILGSAVGAAMEALFPAASDKTSTGVLMLEVAAEAAAISAIMAISDRTLLQAIDPQGESGGGLYFLGLVYTTPAFQVKTKILAARARIVAEALLMAPKAKDVKTMEEGSVSSPVN